MLRPTPGFIPPPVPLVPVAANGIVATGGLLAGAAAGAKAGAVLGPKGALAGAIAGALLVPLLFPQPTAPGTLPGLDPGLNPKDSPEPDPIPSNPDEWWEPPQTNPRPGTRYRYRWFNAPKKAQSAVRDCDDGKILQAAGTYPYYSTARFADEEYAYGIAFRFDPASESTYCAKQTQPWTYKQTGYVRLKQADGTWIEKTLPWSNLRDGSLAYEGFSRSATNYQEVEELTVDGEPVPESSPNTKPRPQPRPLPVPIKPLPQTDPVPAPVPLPEPEPQPQPLEVPSPNTPNAPPITIPKAPPGEPQPVPGPGPQPGPLPSPNRPTPIAPPLPIPGVPTVPEPTPDPNVVPAPGPTPLPSPSPSPAPGTDPEPGTTPLPQPNPAPTPNTPTVPTVPDTSTPTVPDGSVAPQPTPLPVPTPPNVHFPVPGGPPVTDGGTRPDLSSIAAEVGRIEQKTASLQNNQKDIPWWLIGPILEALGALLEQDIPGTTYTLQGVCECVEDGQDQPIAEFEVEPAKNLGAIINRLDTIDQMLQQHLAWKTPICKPCITPKGDWRTISFVSDEVSPYGNARLRKRFRYRSLSGLGLSAVIDHWKDFVWSAGPVCVQHADADWGTPQCWASSADEGKRVIRHAAGEAGIDPDQDGRWIVSGSDSARVGVPGTMRVNRKGGYYWITARDGSEGRPLVGTIDSNP